MTVPPFGSGLLAIFVDLDPADQPGFRPFLAEDMFPPRVEIGFGPVGSFDRIAGIGQQFLTMYVAPTVGDLYGVPYQDLREDRGARDAAYHEKFRNQERYTAAWVGPEVASPEPDELASFIQVDRLSLTAESTQGFNTWFVCDYLPAIARLGGVTSVRRYLVMEGVPTHLVIHELANPDVVDDPGWLGLRGPFADATSGLYERRLPA